MKTKAKGKRWMIQAVMYALVLMTVVGTARISFHSKKHHRGAMDDPCPQPQPEPPGPQGPNE